MCSISFVTALFLFHGRTACQAKSLGDKRLSEQAVKRLKDAAQAAVRRREKALYDSREAVVS